MDEAEKNSEDNFIKILANVNFENDDLDKGSENKVGRNFYRFNQNKPSGS